MNRELPVHHGTEAAEPFRHCGRVSHPEATMIQIGEVRIGQGSFCVIAGPCTVESEEQITAVAKTVKAAGAHMLRGGAFKPRTSPYDFQGLKEEGLAYLKAAKKATGLPVVSECMGIAELPLFEDVDVIQIGARNMQNYELLKAVGRTRKPVLLKRGIANTITEFLMSAEYIMAEGNDQVILCERGIRVFDDEPRNTPDLLALSLLRERTHLPVIADPSHATGSARHVPAMALAATAAGADGLLIEVHNDPTQALCDGAQALTPEAFEVLTEKLRKIRAVIGEGEDARGLG